MAGDNGAGTAMETWKTTRSKGGRLDFFLFFFFECLRATTGHWFFNRIERNDDDEEEEGDDDGIGESNVTTILFLDNFLEILVDWI